MLPVVAEKLTESRQQRLLRELRFALANAPEGTSKAWVGESGKILVAVFVRRGKNVMSLGKKIKRFATQEWEQGRKAVNKRGFAEHAGRRVGAGMRAVKELGGSLKAFGMGTAKNLVDNPKEKVPEAAVAMLAFVTGSGGLDGDGGAPDLDLMFGIDAHRSILSHSVLIAGTFEAALLSTALLVTTVHSYLPAQRDPIWDAIEHWTKRYAVIAGIGLSAGVAYHLAVDGVLQPAAYKDLPFSMPMEAHQAIFVANAAVETVDISKRKPPTR